MPFFNKQSIATLVMILLTGCAGTKVDTGTDVAQQADGKLPRSYEQALVLMRKGDYQASLPELRSFIEDRPGLAGPWVNLGIAYQQMGQREKALEALQMAVQLNPGSAEAHHQLGIELREQGRFDSALQAYQQALQLNADYALAHRNIGILYDLYLQRPVMALEHYRKYQALAAEPEADVDRWVIDLERRIGSTQARIGQ